MAIVKLSDENGESATDKHLVINCMNGEAFACDTAEEAAELADWHNRLAELEE